MIAQFHRFIRSKNLFLVFTWFTRCLLAIAFIPSGLKKVMGMRFTQIGIDNPVGFFFEALYQSGFYWNFLGFVQILIAVLLMVPRLSYLGAIFYLPVIINIFVIVTAMGFAGTPYIAGMMLLANLYLLFWDLPKTLALFRIISGKADIGNVLPDR